METTAPQICTVRLKPFRQRIHRTVMTITDNGCVSMEIMCRHANQPNNQEIVKELFRVSPDGRNVEVYQNQDGVVAQDGCPLPGQAFKLFTYPELPGKHMKKYQHAHKFVELVKSRTAKVVLNTDAGQCKLMENSHPADFKADFHNGSSVVISKSTVTVTDRGGATLTFDSRCVSQCINPDTLRLVHTAHMCHHKCLEIESYISAIHPTGVNNEMFPVIIGSSKNPYHVTPELDGESTLQPGMDAEENQHSEYPSIVAGETRGNGTGQASGQMPAPSWTCGTPGQSICSEDELSRLLDGQLSDFGGSSRPSSLKSGSRSETPHTQNSLLQCGESPDVCPPAFYNRFPSDPGVCLGHLEQSNGLHDISTASHDQFYTNYSNTTVPSCGPQHSQSIETNVLSSRGSSASLLNHGSNTFDSLDCSLRSNSYGFSTPCKNSVYHQRQQQQSSGPSHSISQSEPGLDCRPRCDDKTQLLLEHRHSLVSGQLESSVRRALDLDLSLPISSPLPMTGTHALQRDLLAIRPTPSLNLSDCCGGPDGDRHQDEEDQFLEFPSFQSLQQSVSRLDNPSVDLLCQSVSDSPSIHPPTLETDAPGFHLPHQSASGKVVEDFTSSQTFAVDPVRGGLNETKRCDLTDSSTQVQSMSAACSKAIEQTVLASETVAKMNLVHNSSGIQTLPNNASPLHQNWPGLLSATEECSSSNPPPMLKSSASHSSSQTPHIGVTRPRLNLGLNNNHKGSNRNSNTQATRCCSADSSNDSSNTSSSLDLTSPQPTGGVHSTLPPHLRHSLDMSASSHYSDSSAPSSSCAGDVVRQLFVPYTGWASLHATGAVWILYNDGTQIGVKSTEPAMIYVDQDSTEIRYSNTDAVPEIVRLKLEKLPSIVDQLMRAPVTPSPAQLSRSGPGTFHKG